MELVGLQHMAADRADQRIQQVARRAHPVGEWIDPDRSLRAHKSGSAGAAASMIASTSIPAHGRVTRTAIPSRDGP